MTVAGDGLAAVEGTAAKSRKRAAFDRRWQGVSIPSYHWHFHRRLLTRYGIVLAPGDFSGMVRDIRGGRAELVERRPRGGLVYAVEIKSVRRHVYVLMVGPCVISAWPPMYDLNAKYQEIDDVLRLPQWRLAGSGV